MEIELTLRPTVRAALLRSLPKERLLKILKKLSDDLGCKGCVLSILFTDDKEMKALNQAHRGKKKTTDVLSFPLDDTRAFIEKRFLGDLVISLPTAKKQAREYGVTIAEEVLRLLVHGFLHLLGYDHENVSPRKAREMERKEEELYRKLVPILSQPKRKAPVKKPKG